MNRDDLVKWILNNPELITKFVEKLNKEALLKLFLEESNVARRTLPENN